MQSNYTAFAFAILAFLASGCQRGIDPEANNVEVEGGYDVTLRWTPNGIPHVTAKDWGSLGFGIAYATATDTLCTLAREILVVRGEQAKYFGPDEGRRDSDVFYRGLLTAARLAALPRDQPPAVTALRAGYVAGYNRYLKDHPPESRSPGCRDAEWVLPMEEQDLVRLALAEAIRGGLAGAQQAILAARPPALAPATPATGTPTTSPAAPPTGSNAIAIGGAASSTGRGLLLANPHDAWTGAARYHVAHLTIPGQLDSMGAMSLRTLLPTVGFNANVAWTQTQSSAQRTALYALELVPGNPTRYRWGSETRALEQRQIEIDVLGKREQRALWFSHLGPVLADAELPWTAARAFVLMDVNLENDRAARTALGVNTARSVAEVRAALQRGLGVANANTVAADRAGEVLYADVGRMPNIDYPFLVRCQVPDLRGWRNSRAVILRATPECALPRDPQAPSPGVLAPARMPVLIRNDYAINSNDSHWLAHAEQRLEGFSPVLGEEGTARNARTRTAHAALATLLGGNKRVSIPQLQSLITRHSDATAAALARDLTAVCTREARKVELANGNPADVGRACNVIAKWDGSYTAQSRGALLWMQFWPRALAVENLWRRPFRLDEPLRTPAGINVESQPVRENVLRALVEAQDALAAVGVGLDAPLGSVQYVTADKERIAIPGGTTLAGAYSVIDMSIEHATARARIDSGNSWVQVVGWDRAGKVQASGMLTYSQSDDPASEHAYDLTRRYSKGEWLPLPFTAAEIDAAGVQQQFHLRDARE